MKTLLIINFKTGDCECPYDTYLVIVKGEVDTISIKECFDSYFQSNLNEDNFATSINTVLNQSGLDWQYAIGGFYCDKITRLYI